MKRESSSREGGRGKSSSRSTSSRAGGKDFRAGDRDKKFVRSGTGDKKPFERKPSGERRKDDRPFAERSFERKPYVARKKEDKPFAEKTSREKHASRSFSKNKTYRTENKLTGSDERPKRRFGDDEGKRSFAPKAGKRDDERGERKDFARDKFPKARTENTFSGGGEKKRVRKSEANSLGEKRRGKDFPERNSERKPFGERREFGKPNDDSRERKPFGERREYKRADGDSRERKPYGERGDFKKPFRSPGDSSDTKPLRGSEPFRGGERGNRPAREGEDRKWNRKSDNEFYGDRRKSSRSFGAKKSFDRPKEDSDGLTRLNKYIANAGICSRREADDMITAGVVSVNGEVITELGYKVKQGDVVKYNNEELRSERLVYLLLNKPKDFITTMDDPQDRKTVMWLIRNTCKERVYPVGRLDRNTTGVLLLTNDGDLTKKLTHPSFEVQKIYQAELDKPLKTADMELIEKGIQLEDGFIKVDDIAYVGTAQDKSVIGVELHSGKNRIVRRIFEHLGYEVKKLDRVYFAGLSKKDLARGRSRFLTELEIASLKMVKSKMKTETV